MKFLYLDTETTGLDPVNNGVHQIAGIIEIDGVIKEKFDFKFQPIPGELVDPKALDVSGLTVEKLRERPMTSQQAYVQVVGLLGKYVDRYNKTDKFIMVGQNTKFDYDFVQSWFKKHGNGYFYAYVFYHLIDIITATALFKTAGKIVVTDMKLATVAKFFGIDLEAHDAANDIAVTREIFLRYVGIIQKQVTALEAAVELIEWLVMAVFAAVVIGGLWGFGQLLTQVMLHVRWV